MIAMIDYDAGNVASVSNALTRLGVEHVITSDHSVLDEARGVIFPGVGHAEAAMRSLIDRGLDQWILLANKPVLGICVGLQLMFESSEESTIPTLGIFPGHLKKFDSREMKVPHMGWNTFKEVKRHPLLIGLDASDYHYFVHSFYPPLGDVTLASCDYGVEFTAVAARGNFMGVQYHPEKSGAAGATLLRNFCDIVYQPIAI
jgi:imidazole glycerol-phosphate synthase subunit HisH